MVEFFIRAIFGVVRKTAGYAARQALSGRSGRYYSDEELEVLEKIHNRAQTIKFEAEKYSNWLQEGVSRDVDDLADEHLFSQYEVPYNFAELKFPEHLIRFPDPPIEWEIVRISIIRKWLGRFSKTIDQRNSEMLEKKKDDFKIMVRNYEFELSNLVESRKSFQKKWEHRQTEYNQNYNHSVSFFQALKSSIEHGQPGNYGRYLEIVVQAFQIPYGEKLIYDALSYDQQNRSATLKLILPSPQSLPKIKTARYLKTYQSVKKTEYSENQLKANYYKYIETIIHNLTYFIFTTDDLSAIETIKIFFVKNANGENLVQAELKRPEVVKYLKHQSLADLRGNYSKLKINKKAIGELFF